ncbi:hypothetical protein GCM10012275_04560 [Longimycelium tulufanense]|uniref:Low molecular weight protein antigen 6 PH domain-containing protein n=1 Tax=Longimycelium tulufanense TaxID=907463 RepID=A0A8J3CA00_9PSEU|nr:PH domain-containing protein [Longimycelium tulufanense]GGM36419.1 hypothetical protein GCM10012275_04560 [Longimycelium tulufanense]
MSEPATPEPQQSADAPGTVARPAPRAVFRHNPIGIFGVFFLALCMTPVAWGAPGLQAIYLLPLGLLVWLLRVRTDVGVEGIRLRTVLGRRELPWSELTSLRVSERSWVRAVLRDGTEVTLPSVRARHLPLLATVSGRLPNPIAEQGESSATVDGDASENPEAGDTPAVAGEPDADGGPRSRADDA